MTLFFSHPAELLCCACRGVTLNSHEGVRQTYLLLEEEDTFLQTKQVEGLDSAHSCLYLSSKPTAWNLGSAWGHFVKQWRVDAGMEELAGMDCGRLCGIVFFLWLPQVPGEVVLCPCCQLLD